MSWFNLLFQEFIFSTQLHLKIPVELINHFDIHPTWATAMQSRLEFLQLMYDFLASKNTFTSSVCIFSVVPFFGVNQWPNGYRSQLQSLCWRYHLAFDSRAAVLVVVGMNVKHASAIVKFKIKSNKAFA